MKIRIYKSFLTLALLAMTLTSCKDWLDLYPSDEIKEEYLFSSGDGFRTALNGIYRKLATFDLYGSNLTWGIVDAWGHVYYMAQAPDNGGGKAMKKIMDLNFKNTELVPTTDAMWNAAWGVIANCNELVQQAAVADSTLFYRLDTERRMILGEAIGLRAFMHFDLLRMYAPAPSSVGYREDSRTFIPYVDVYPSYVNEHQTVSYCLEHIINDLKEAQSILHDVDMDAEMAPGQRFDTSASGENLFFVYRGYRLNYYAVTAELARVYLYAGKSDEAYAEAKKIIDVEEEKGYFEAETSSYSGPENIKNGNIKMYEDIIFGLYSPTELTDWDNEINHASDGKSEYDQYYLSIHKEMVAKIWGEEKEDDWRLQYQFEPKYSDYYYRPLKYSKQQESSTYGKVNNRTIPLIRMSEVYYIAAEAIYDKNKEEAQKYLSLVKEGRGISSVDYSKVSSKDEFVNMIVSDARREFVGEGQTLFMFKRLNKVIDYYGGEMMPADENVVLPQPDSETNIQ